MIEKPFDIIRLLMDIVYIMSPMISHYKYE